MEIAKNVEPSVAPIDVSAAGSAKGLTVSGENDGFTLKVPASTGERVLQLSLAVEGGRALIEASVSGGGAHFFTDHTFESHAGWAIRVYTVNFTAARKGQVLTLNFRLMNQQRDHAGRVAMLGAQLQMLPAANRAPRVSLIGPAPYFVGRAPAAFEVEAEASDPDGFISKVEFYDFSIALPLGVVEKPPYRITVQRSGAWSGSICARAYDNHGRWTDSQPVRYSVDDPSRRPPPAARPLFTGFPSKGVPGLGFEGVSAMAELPGGDIFAVWYGGKYELSPDSAIYASTLRRGSGEWTPPRIIIDEPNVAEGNAVLLFRQDELWCFYVEAHGASWEFSRLFYRKSHDRGITWGAKTALPAPAFQYPTGTLVATPPRILRNGDILLPLNRESYNSDANKQWFSLFMISADGGKTWKETAPLFSNPGNIQPAVVQLPDETLLALLRVRGQRNHLWRSVSTDNGRTWSRLEQTGIPNPSARVGLGVLPDGKLVLAFNNSNTERTPLNLALSDDAGKTWPVNRVIESGKFSYTYPSLLVAEDGSVHVTYNDNYFGIKHVIVNEAWLREP